MSLLLAICITRSNWLLLFVGIGLLAEAGRARASGTAILFYRVVTRSEHGYQYWLAIWIGAILGVGCLIGFVFTLFNPQYLPDSSR